MAEFYMTYDEIFSFIDQIIRDNSELQSLQEYQPEIMASVMRSYDISNHKEATDSVDFWKNMISNPTQLRVGTYYIRVQGAMLEFIKIALCSGLVDAIISSSIQATTLQLTVATTSQIVVALSSLFGCVSKLEDDDFCVFMQAVTHFREHKPFTEEELINWFPKSEKPVCNMHNSTWRCDFILDKDTCGMTPSQIKEALKSLQGKGILKSKKNKDGVYEFYFLM